MSGKAPESRTRPRPGVGVEGEEAAPYGNSSPRLEEKRGIHFQILSDPPFSLPVGKPLPRVTATLIMEDLTSPGLTPLALPCFPLCEAAQVIHQPHLFHLTASSQGNLGVPFPSVERKETPIQGLGYYLAQCTVNLSSGTSIPADPASAIHPPSADFSL